MFWPESVTREPTITGEPEYPYHQKAAVEALINEAWNCLQKDSLIIPAPGINGQNGWMVFTRAGEEAASSNDAMQRIRTAKTFPKAMLHPSIVDIVWPALMRGELSDAVLKSFRAVEEAVRAAGGYADDEVGVPLMRTERARRIHRQFLAALKGKIVGRHGGRGGFSTVSNLVPSFIPALGNRPSIGAIGAAWHRVKAERLHRRGRLPKSFATLEHIMADFYFGHHDGLRMAASLSATTAPASTAPTADVNSGKSRLWRRKRHLSTASMQ
jgi:hypothetical protein